jgi:hypothetical protein
VLSKRALIEAVGRTSGGAIGRLNVRRAHESGRHEATEAVKEGWTVSAPRQSRSRRSIAMIDLRVQDAAGITADRAAYILPTQE